MRIEIFGADRPSVVERVFHTAADGITWKHGVSLRQSTRNGRRADDAIAVEALGIDAAGIGEAPGSVEEPVIECRAEAQPHRAKKAAFCTGDTPARAHRTEIANIGDPSEKDTAGRHPVVANTQAAGKSGSSHRDRVGKLRRANANAGNAANK